MNTFSRAKALFSVYFIAAIDNFGYGIVFVLFPPLLLDPKYGFLSHHPSIAERLLTLGALYAAFPIAQLLGAPIFGELADRYGRKKIFFITILGTILGYVITGFTLSLKSVFLLFLSRFVTGFFSGNQGLCNASIADLSPNEKQRARNYGLLTVVWGLSFPIAILMGGYLSDPALSSHFSPSLPFYLGGLITVLSLITVLIFYPETFTTSEKSPPLDLMKGFHNIMESLRFPGARRFFLLMLIWTLGWGFSVSWYGVYCLQRFEVSQQAITWGLVIQGIFWTLGGAIVKPVLLRYMNLLPIARTAFFLAAFLLLVSSFTSSFYAFTLTYSISAIMGAISLSSTFNLVSLSSSSSIQGKAMGLTQSMMSLGFFLVPILGGLLGAISIYTFYPVSALFMLVGLGILYKR